MKTDTQLEATIKQALKRHVERGADRITVDVKGARRNACALAASASARW